MCRKPGLFGVALLALICAIQCSFVHSRAAGSNVFDIWKSVTSSFGRGSDEGSHVSIGGREDPEDGHVAKVAELSNEIARLQEETMDFEGELKNAHLEHQHRMDDLDRQKESYDKQLETTRHQLEEWRHECQDTEAMRLCTLYMVQRVVNHGGALDIPAVQEDCRSDVFGAAAESAAAKNLPATTPAPGQTTTAATTTPFFKFGLAVKAHWHLPAGTPVEDMALPDAAASVGSAVLRSQGTHSAGRQHHVPRRHLLSDVSESAYGWMHAKLRQLNRLAYGPERRTEDAQGVYFQTDSRRSAKDIHTLRAGSPLPELEGELERTRQQRDEAKAKLDKYTADMDKQLQAAEWAATHSEQQAVLAAAALQGVQDKCAEEGKKRFCDKFWALKTMKEYEAFARTDCANRVHFLQHQHSHAAPVAKH